MGDEGEKAAIVLAERIKNYLECSGTHGTAPEPESYEGKVFPDRPLDMRNTFVQILASSLRQAEKDTWEKAAQMILGRTTALKMNHGNRIHNDTCDELSQLCRQQAKDGA